ncbi:DNA-binding response regulator, OmpR family, contains REC and winged-helix (wHTH) domain [Dethiosulfatibacter aminovorans DSM 17477]|uniref:DNA-binding response regulator, OmpR family, contains REC and winged-helix (WHTH) domain n=1 Tax=Dethiosulfatibacter aminovorans DSM 17477 TaxID=1121476 RepID=A0A1M6GDK0_9FIRM|nr:response regulator transcription factor [Dethiosulfatibacter aminovorans]SHJ08014.1 DNA-binding response regulator, OmpR family, contains REC and winged-helix (wHTH) domain [Dethiosulfatibacter aminovorans DSM 17477]
MYDVKLLVVEDDERIREILVKYMKKENFELDEASDGKKAIALLEDNKYDLAVLDVMLPDIDGWSILKHIREKNREMPVIMLTARAEEEDKLFGFELGADDYVTKPFSAKELLARVKVQLKKSRRSVVDSMMELGDIKINTEYRQVYVNDKAVELTPIEYSLLQYFADNLNIALTRDQILDNVWGYDYFGDERTVDTHVKRLRKKLLDEGDKIKTVRGHGYRMVVDR